jgi:hypothetical protein
MVEGDGVEEHPRTSHNAMSTGDIAGVEQDSKAKTIDPIQDQIKTSKMQSREILDRMIERGEAIEH